MRRFLTDEQHISEMSNVVWHPPLTTPEMKLVKVYPEIRYQSIVGFGAALTEASGYVFSQMDEATQQRFLDLCFSHSGNRYSLCRLSIQSCDFSLTPRSYAHEPGKNGLTDFSIDDDWAYVLPLVKAAQSRNPWLKFFASPWSPPAWAKTNFSMKHGGRLRHKHYATWAEMIARTLLAYRDAGVDIERISLQNEPQARQTWESCLYSAREEAEFLHEYVKPALAAAGLSRVKTFVWDHNKESAIDRAAAILGQSECAADVDGVAFHWYSGDHFEAVRALRDLVGPDRELIFSEGCDYFSNGWTPAELQHAEHYAHEIIGDLVAGANGIIDWNVLLDAKGGPNHVGNWCDAPIMYDTESGEMHVRLPFAYLGHFSRFIAPGAQRILVTSYTDALETCGFANPDGSFSLVVLNRTDNEVTFDFVLGNANRLKMRTARIKAPAHSIQTLTW